MKNFFSVLPRSLAALPLVLAVFAVGPAAAQEAKGNPGTVRAAALLLRHGVISPKYSLPKVPSVWPMGFMQLTAVGMRQMYDQGQALRKRYVDKLGLIGETFKSSEVYFRSSNMDRALQSAQMVALGLYPLGTGPDPSVYDKSLQPAPAPELAFSAVPIHSAELTDDAVLRPWTGTANCTRYRQYVKALPKTELYVNQAEKYKEFLARIASVTGAAEGESPATMLHEVNETYEPLSAMVQHNMPLPPEITQEDMQLLSDLSDWNYHYQFLGPNVGRLTGGPFVGDVINNFASVIKKEPEARKLYVYSGHQRTMLGVDAALGIETALAEGDMFRGRIRPLGAYYAFELHEPTAGEYALQLSFIDGESEQVVEIPGCGGGMCPFETFVGLMSKVVPANWRQECG